MISVLIACRWCGSLVREGLRMLLESEPDITVAGEAADGAEALTQTRLLDPDVVVMDIRMPEVRRDPGHRAADPGRMQPRVS